MPLSQPAPGNVSKRRCMPMDERIHWGGGTREAERGEDTCGLEENCLGWELIKSLVHCNSFVASEEKFGLVVERPQCIFSPQ